MKEGSQFEPVSREGALVLNNLLLTVLLGLVLIGTLYPLVTEAMGVKVSVGPPYFNTAAGPLALCSSSRWRWGRCCAGGATG